MIYLLLTAILALAVTTALVIRYVARGNAEELSETGALAGRTKAIDVLAFRNLMDPAQEEFLRASLSTKEYWHFKRLRNGVAIGYVAAVYQNAAILIRLGEALQRQPATAEEGVNVVQLALTNRISAALLVAKLAVGWLYPSGHLDTRAVTADYSLLKEKVAGILRRTAPTENSRIVAEL